MAKRKDREKRKIRYTDARKQAESRESQFSSASVSVPDGMEFFALKKSGVARIHILPYIVGKGNPHAKPDQIHYERTFFTHPRIGVDGVTVICVRKTFGKRCPICEHAATVRRDPDGDSDLVKNLEPKERQLWVVKDLSEPDKGFKLWDISYHLFGKHLEAKLRNADEDDPYPNFFHLEGGLTLKLGVKEKSFAGYPYYEVEDVEFKPRDDYDESVLEEIPCLDDLLKEMTYEELKKVFAEIGEDDDSDDDSDDDDEVPRPNKKPYKKPSEDDEDDLDEDDDEDSDDEDEEDDEPPKKTKKKKPEPEDDDDESDGDDDSDDDEDEPPAKKPKKAKSKSKKKDEDDDPWGDEDDLDEDDDEDSDDEDEEDEPPMTKRSKR